MFPGRVLSSFSPNCSVTRSHAIFHLSCMVVCAGGALPSAFQVDRIAGLVHLGYIPCTGRRCTIRTNFSRAFVSVRSSGQPSLSRGWILEPKQESGGGSCAVEVLLSSVEEAEYEKTQKILESVRNEGVQVQMPLVPKAKYVRGADLKKASFVRVYYVSALRVPAKDSSTLAQSLKEHLLNWPRVDNIARVPGDDVHEDMESLFLGYEELSESSSRAVRSAIYGEDGTGNIESTRIHNVKKSEQSSVNGTYANRKQTAVKYQPYTVEVVEEKPEVDRDRSTHGLLVKKWAGPTRLLLLKEEIFGRIFSQLPLSVQVLLERKSRCQLVTCRLTLFYEYWSSEEVLRDLLPPEVMVPDTFERFGHVAFLGLSCKQLDFRHLIAQVTLDKHQPIVRSVVLRQEARYTRSYAVRVELLAGTSSLVTTVWDNGFQFRIDFGSVNWDSRLKEDRRRLVELFSESDVVCDVFAGPGAVAVSAGARVRRTFANEVNPVAYKYLAHNVAASKLTSRVEIFNLDTRQFLENVFASDRPLPVTQVIMTYPSAVSELLDFFVGAFSRSSWELPSLPNVHVYGFSNAADPAEHFSQEIENILGECPKRMDIVRVAEVASGEWMLRASFTIPVQVGFEEKDPLRN